MKSVKRIFVIMLLAAFTLNAGVGVAMAGCMCGSMSSDMMKMEKPCHDGMETAQADQSDEGEKQTSKCSNCKCGHCKTHSQASLNQNASSTDLMSTGMSLMPHSDVMISNIIFGIDNPPKQLS